LFCGGGVYSAIDLSLYLVERYGGPELAVETAKALLLETPRMWQSGYGAEPPLGYLHRLRIDAARHLLETRGKSIADVGQAVGYDDLGFFRRLFKRHTGAPPQAYRARFGPGRARAVGA